MHHVVKVTGHGGMVSTAGQVDPASPPLLEQLADALHRGHTHADPTHPPGVLVRAIGAASRMGLAVWMPWPSSPTPWHPQSVLPFYSILRSQFRWRLTIASDVFMCI